MAEDLYKIGSPVNAKNRRVVNMTYDDILDRFNDFQRQINILYGGKAAQDILESIESAIQTANNANSDAQAAVNTANTAINQLTILISDTNASAQRAENAADDADQMNQILNRLKGELEQLQVDLNGIVQAEAQRVSSENGRTDAEQLRVTAENSRVSVENTRKTAEQSRVTAETNRETAEQARNDAEVIRQKKLAELLDILNELDFKGEYDPTASYKAFNVVRFGRASYVALQDVSGVTPSDDGINWRILAAGGMDGAGAVSTVNNIQPDSNGNINLIIDYINNLTSDRIDVGLSAAMGKFLMSLIEALQNDKADAEFVVEEVARAVAALVNEAPETLNTINALAAALGDDPNFATTIMQMLGDKASNAQLAQTNNNLTTLGTKVNEHMDHDNPHPIYAKKAQEPWINATKLNGWIDENVVSHTTAAYFKDEFGFVHLRGVVKDGVVGWTTSIFDLPVGYRPARDLGFGVLTADENGAAIGRLNVFANGSVNLEYGKNVYVTLENIVFKAEQ